MVDWMSTRYYDLVGRRKMCILMLGPEDAGKTTILYNYKSKIGKDGAAIPTSGFNIETVLHKNVQFEIWDVSGRREILFFWRYHLQIYKGLIFVVDSSDIRRIREARNKLDALLGVDKLRDSPLLVLANKQDLPDAMNPAQLTDKLGLRTLRHREWHIQASCAANRKGLREGLKWLAKVSSTRHALERGPSAAPIKHQPCPVSAANDEHCEIARQILDSPAGRPSDRAHVDLFLKAMAAANRADLAKEVEMTREVLKSWSRERDNEDQETER